MGLKGRKVTQSSDTSETEKGPRLEGHGNARKPSAGSRAFWGKGLAKASKTQCSAPGHGFWGDWDLPRHQKGEEV